jgi:hypothetical protein
MKNIFVLAFIAVFFWNCEKTVSLDIDQTPELYVIEGLLTDEFKAHQVRIRKTIFFNGEGNGANVSEAEVYVEDDEGQIYPYAEKEAGIYESIEPFAGVAGKTYTLHVEHEGEVFHASDQLKNAPPIDSLATRLDEEEMADPDDEGRFYEVLVYLSEPQETEDFYLVKFYRNGEIENENGDFVFVYDDLALGSTLEALPAAGYYAIDDMFRIELYSLSQGTFRYYQDLADNIGNDGGMFSGQPANVRTNMKGGAIGLFETSGVASMEIQL